MTNGLELKHFWGNVGLEEMLERFEKGLSAVRAVYDYNEGHYSYGHDLRSEKTCSCERLIFSHYKPDISKRILSYRVLRRCYNHKNRVVREMAGNILGYSNLRIVLGRGLGGLGIKSNFFGPADIKTFYRIFLKI